MADLKRSAKAMRSMLSWLFTLMPVAIGLASFALLKGWLPIRGLESASDLQRKNFRKAMLTCGIVFTLVGVGSILQEVGALNALAEWARTIE